MRANQAWLALGLLLCTGLASGQTTGKALDINLNSDAVRAKFSWRLGDPRYLADVGWLYNQDRGSVVHGSFHLVDEAANPGTALQAGLGLRLVYTTTDPSRFDGGSLALGGFVKYTFPNANRFSIGGHGYYAPDIVSFGDQSQYYEIAVRAAYNVIRDADVYIGVREVEAKYDGGGRYEYDSNLHAGLEFRF